MKKNNIIYYIFVCKKYLLLFVLVFITSLFISGEIFAQATYVWNATSGGDFQTAGNWTPPRSSLVNTDILQFSDGNTYVVTDVPTQTIGKIQLSGNTNVTIKPNTSGNATLTVNTAATGAISVASGSTLVIDGVTTNSRTLKLTTANTASLTAEISGTIEVSIDAANTSAYGVFTKGGTNATINMNSGGVYQHDVGNSSGVVIPTCTWNTGSTCNVTGITSTAPTGFPQNFYNLTWNCSNQTAINVYFDATTNIGGAFKIYSTGAGWLIGSHSNAVTITVNGDMTVTGGVFYVNSNKNAGTPTLNVNGSLNLSGGSVILYDNSGDYSEGAAITISTDLNLSGSGIFDFGPGTYPNSVTFNLAGNFNQTGGTFENTATTDHNGIMNFTKSGTQTFTQTSGTFTNTYVTFTVNSGSILQLSSNFSIASTLTVASGGTLDIPNPYYTTGSGATTISSGATLRTGNTQGISSTANTGCIQTTTNTCDPGASYVYNGTVAQVTGNKMSTVANLTLNNSEGVTFTQSLTVSNAGTLTITSGYHNLQSYTLTLGTSAATTLTYTAGGLYSSSNNGSLTRYIPNSTTITATSGNYYGLFPFAKTSGQLGLFKISTSTATTNAGTISIIPTFGSDNVVTCSVADGGNTIVREQVGSNVAVTVASITGGTTAIEYDCGTNINSTGSATDLCLATYNASVAGVLGTYSANTGTKVSPQVIRTAITSVPTLKNNKFVLASYNTNSPVSMQCVRGGTYTVGPTATYATLTDAINDLSSYGLASSVIYELQSNYVSTYETFPIVINNFDCQSGSNTITIRPASGATGLSISGSNATAIFSIDGGTYVTIDGEPGGTGGVSQLTITNTSTSAPVIKFIDDANNNTLKYCTITGAYNSTSNGLINFSAATSGGNSNNFITNNTIQGITNAATIGIYSAGSASYTNTANQITNNSFVDFAQDGIKISSNTDTWIITGNSFYQSASQTPAATIYNLYVNAGSGYTVTGNYFGGEAASCGGSYYTLSTSVYQYLPLYFSSSCSGGSTNTISSNTFDNISYTTTNNTASNYVFACITANGSSSYVIGSNGKGNTIGETSGVANSGGTKGILITDNEGSTASRGTSLINIDASTGSGIYSIACNKIGAVTVSGSSTTTGFGGIIFSGSGTATIDNNTLGNTTSNNIALSTTSGASLPFAFISNINGSGTNTFTVTNSTIQNWNISATTGADLRGIHNYVTGVPFTCTGNTITGITSSLTGKQHIIAHGYVGSAETSTCNISNNNISNINYSSSSSTTAVYMIYCNSSATSTVNSNTIGNNSNTNDITVAVNAKINGIYNQGAGALNSASNVISQMYASNATSGTILSGYYLNGGVCTISNNTIQNVTCKATSTTTHCLAGIDIESTGASTSITGNIISSLSWAGTASNQMIMEGILSYLTANTASITKNKITGLTSTSTHTSSDIEGIYLASHTAAIDLKNNFIYITNGSNTNDIYIDGILLASSSTAGTSNVYHNTVYIGGSTTANHLTACFYNLNTASTTVNCENNVFVNGRTGSPNYYQYVYEISTTTGGAYDYNYDQASNNSYTANWSGALTFASWQSGHATHDDNGTITVLTNATLSSADATTVSTSTITSATTGVTDDIFGTSRNATTPERGCYESLPTTYYWVAGTGNWSDYSNHWATTSGGSPIAPAAPTSSISVNFDGNSGTGTCTVDATANCNNITCTGYTGTLAGSNALNVYGSVTLVSGMTCTYSGTMSLLATSGNNTFASGTKSIGALTVNGSGGTFNLSDNMSLAGAFSLSNGTFSMNGHNLTIAGNFLISGGTFTSSSGTLRLNGTTQNFTSNGTSFGNITLSVGTVVSMQDDLTIISNLTLTSGVLTLGSHTLTLGTSSADLTDMTGSSSAYINASSTGVVKYYHNTVSHAYLYPLGDASNYTPFTFNTNTLTLTSGSYTTLTVTNSSQAHMGGQTSYIARYWSLKPYNITIGGGNYNVSYTYVAGDVHGTEASLTPYKYSASTWTSGGGAPSSQTFTWTGVTSFSDFTGLGGNPLPVELLSFNAECNDEKIKINWSTAAEINSDYFKVEKSLDNNNWDYVTTVSGAGNSNSEINYAIYDESPYKETTQGLEASYYRLKQVDFNGNFKYYGPVPTICREQYIFNTYLNTNKNIIVNFAASKNQNYNISLFDYNGKKLIDINSKASDGLNNVSLNTANFSAGVYILVFKNKDEYETKKIVIN